MSPDIETQKLPGRWVLALVLAFTFLSFFMIPARVRSMRRRFAANSPEKWAKVADNGPFRAVLPYKDLGYADEGLYAARARQAALHGLPYGPRLGHRTLKSWVFDCLMFYPVAVFIRLCGGNLSAGWTLSHAVLGCGWLLMLFGVFRAYGKDEPSALMLSAFVLFFTNTLNELLFAFYYSFLKPGYLASKLSVLVSGLFTPVSLYMRQPSPAASYLWIAAGLAAALMVSRSSRVRPLASTAAGVFCGLLCFVHFFEWVGGVAALCLLAAESWTDRKASRSARANLTLSAAAAAAVSCAYFLFARRMTADTMHDVIELNGVWGRRFGPLSIPFFLSALLFWRLGTRRTGTRRQVMMTAAAVNLGAAFIANAALVLGYDLQFGEHAAYLAAFAAMIGGGCWLLEQRAFQKRLRPHALLLTAFFCAWYSFKAKAWADSHYKFYGIPQDAADAFAWLDANAPKHATLLALSAPINFLIPLETELDSPVAYAQPNADEPVTLEANSRAFASLLKTFDADPERFRAARWRIGDPAERARTELAEELSGTLDWDDRERMLWPFFLRLDTKADPDDARRAEAWKRVEADLRQARPQRPPFYAWVQKSDEPLLRHPMSASGGRLAYRGGSVSLYAFDDAAPERR